jgi:hypothetical protein
MTPNRQTDEKRVNEEAELLDHVQRLAKYRGGRRAVHLHLSRLRPANRRGDRIRIALNSFEFMVRHFEGQIFALSNADIVFVCKDADIEAIDDAVMRVRHLFSDDPLMQGLDGQDIGRFCS